MRELKQLVLAIGVSLLLLATGAAARGTSAPHPSCVGLTGDAKALADKLMASQYPYDCCDKTIGECLKQDPVCALAWRLAGDICRRVADGQDEKAIVRGLSRRARSMMPGGKRADIDLNGAPALGPADAPVVVVEYACARCPFCSKITPPLVSAVRQGPLANKVRLIFKPFPIRSHPFSKETGLGLLAAARMGKFWPFLLYSYEHFDDFGVKKQRAWAQAAGLDGAAFEQLVSDPAVRQALIDSKKEGLRNKVEATPTFFINGRKYVGDLDLLELIDVLQEEHERLQGKVHRQVQAGPG